MRRILFCLAIIIGLSVHSHSARSQDFPWCVAHRGYSAEHLENSRAAIEAAVQAGADAIEIDIRHTLDGHALVVHDARLKRTARSKAGKRCKLNTPIGSIKYNEIREHCALINGEEIPRLDEVLNSFTGFQKALLLEFKDMPSVESLELLQQYQRSSLKIFAVSFEQKVLDLIAKQGLVFHEPMKLIWLTPIPVHLPERFDGLGPYLISDGLIEHLKDNQKIIDMWTVDRPKKMQALFTKGVHMITTNKIESCLEAKNL